MSSFEWMELQTLISDIETARDRLADARRRKDVGRVRGLEEEITRAEQRRLQLVTHISTSIATSEPAPRSGPAPTAAAAVWAAPAAAASQPISDPAAAAAEVLADGAPASAATTDSIEGGNIVWDQLTPGDIERAKNELSARRAEMLARHAEELRGLDAEQSQLESLEQAIDSFLQRFKRPSAGDGVVALDQQRAAAAG